MHQQDPCEGLSLFRILEKHSCLLMIQFKFKSYSMLMSNNDSTRVMNPFMAVASLEGHTILLITF